MKPQGRILVMDDEARWRNELRKTLETDGFFVDDAGTMPETERKLSEAFYHLLVFDIRLEEADSDNTEGMVLLKKLFTKLEVGDAVDVIMLSAHGTKEQMREAFRDYHVADFLTKEEFDNLKFLENVKGIFQNRVKINLDLDIHWQDISGSEQAVINLEIGENRIKRNSDDQLRVAVEMDDLLRRLFCKAKSVILRPLTPGHSGAGVLWAKPFYATAGGGQAVVIKYGDFHKIDEEYQNYMQYVKPFIGGGRRTSVLDLRRTPKLGAISYSLLGSASDQYHSFGYFYQDPDTSLPQIQKTLDNLFRRTCSSWYANVGQLCPFNLTEDYQSTLKFSLDKLSLTLEKGLKSVQGKERLHFRSLKADRDFRNPVLALTDQTLVRSTYESITHGDLNESNIFVDEESNTWLIDFMYTGPGHILRDVIKLDTVVRLQLLKEDQATLDERLELELALLQVDRFSQLDSLSPQLETDNIALTKAYQVSLYLRNLAFWMVQHDPNDDFSEYDIGALYHALNAIRYYSLPTIQREHALLSASLLAEKLGL